MSKFVFALLLVVPALAMAKDPHGSGNPRADQGGAESVYEAAKRAQAAQQAVERQRDNDARWIALVQHARELANSQYGIEASGFTYDITPRGEIILVGSAQVCKFTPDHEACSRCGGGTERTWQVKERIDCAARAR